LANRTRTNYEILDVAEDASDEAIRFAYGRMLGILKRDNPDDAGAIAGLRKAYDILNDPVKRTAYDQYLTRVPSGRTSSTSSFSLVPWIVGAIFISIAAGIYFSSRKKPAVDKRNFSTITAFEPSSAGQMPTPVDNAAVAVAPLPPPADALNSEQLFAKVSPSVARITVMNASGTPVATGSGVVIAASQVITNCHVALAGAQLVVKIGGESLPATIEVADQEFDLCKLYVSQLRAPAVTFGRVAEVRTGQRVYAIGAPHGLDLTLSDGLVSSLREAPQGTYIQTSAPVSPGSSGGGLFDTSGKLVGIVTFQHKFGQNLNFAVPVDWIEQMRTRGTNSQVAASAIAASSSSVPSVRPDELRQVLTTGKWHCANSVSGRNAEMTFDNNGYVNISRGGSVVRAQYSVSGNTLTIRDSAGSSTTTLESKTEDRLVFSGGTGTRMVCERQ
jgi:serine protease Do